MSLPIVLLPVGVDDAALDACLGALETHTPAGTRVWLADDAQSGPRGIRVIEAWLARTRLQADYTRRPRMLGEVAHLDEMLRACAGADVGVLAADAQPLPGWLQQLSACLARDAAIASATPWSNAGEACAWPRLGEINPVPEDGERLARACAALPPLHPELPAAVCHAVAEGCTRFEALALWSDGARALMPCGACRQVLAEFGLGLRVLVGEKGGGLRLETSLAALLPHPLEPRDLR